MQKTVWQPPTNSALPEVVSAAKSLFEQGLADPRGCDYREIEIHTGDVWRGDGGVVRTHGWLIPQSPTNQSRYAVCWNGLVYPVVAVGGQIDLRADMENLIRTAPTNRLTRRMDLYSYAVPERMSVAADSVLPIKACLLLRLGEVELSTRFWDACKAARENVPGGGMAKDPYLTLAGDWAWSAFDRGICAHMQGNVPLALISARRLAEIQPKIESEAARRGFPHPGYNDVAKHERERPYLYFLDQLPQWLVDLERRAREPVSKSALEAGLTNFPSQSKRIAALIKDLDQVSAPQMSQPGMVMPEGDPIVAALIKEGDAAVEPLLRCLEHDTRLTRSVGFSRDFRRDRIIITVRRAARAAIENILHTQFPGGAPEIRAYWNRYRGQSAEERWYSVLRNEKITQEQSVLVGAAGSETRRNVLVLGRGPWMDAARVLVQPDNVLAVPGSGHYVVNPLPPGAPVKIRGEVLRAKKNPSVTELLLQQAEVVVDQANRLDQFQGVDAIRIGCELTQIIRQWEKPAARAPARALLRRAIELCSDRNSFIMSSGHDLARYIPQLVDIGVDTGDTAALVDYAQWVKSVDAATVEQYALEAFAPLVRNPRDANAVSAAEWLFNDPSSPWNQLPWKGVSFPNPVESDLIRLPAFRKLLARELSKTNVIGSMEYFRPDTITYSLKDFGGGSRGFPWPPATAPAIGTKAEIRHCDWIAFSLSNAKRIPFFNPFAPIEERDEAIRNARVSLEKPE